MGTVCLWTRKLQTKIPRILSRYGDSEGASERRKESRTIFANLRQAKHLGGIATLLPCFSFAELTSQERRRDSANPSSPSFSCAPAPTFSDAASVSVFPSVHPSLSLSIFLSIYVPISQYIHIHQYPSLSLVVALCLSLSLTLSCAT